MAKIVTRTVSKIVLPFMRLEIKRTEPSWADLPVTLVPLSAELRAALERGERLCLGRFLVSPAIEDALEVSFSVSGRPYTNGLVSAALLKQVVPGHPVPITACSDVVASVRADRDLMLDCGFEAFVMGPP